MSYHDRHHTDDRPDSDDRDYTDAERDAGTFTFDPDAVKVPDPYTPEEWAATEGAREQGVS